MSENFIILPTYYWLKPRSRDVLDSDLPPRKTRKLKKNTENKNKSKKNKFCSRQIISNKKIMNIFFFQTR